jgi:hypothetical protein
VTITAHSIRMVGLALKAAEELAAEGIEAEVIDLRTLRPLDTETIVESVKKTNRCVCVEEGWPLLGIGAELAAQMMEQAFDYLDAPVPTCTGKDVPMPYAANLEKLALPTADEVVAAVRSTRRSWSVLRGWRKRLGCTESGGTCGGSHRGGCSTGPGGSCPVAAAPAPAAPKAARWRADHCLAAGAQTRQGKGRRSGWRDRHWPARPYRESRCRRRICGPQSRRQQHRRRLRHRQQQVPRQRRRCQPAWQLRPWLKMYDGPRVPKKSRSTACARRLRHA